MTPPSCFQPTQSPVRGVPGQAYADLHLHTCFSDGLESPEEMVAAAARLGFRAVAITDHDEVAGCAPALAAGERLAVEVLTGVELSTEEPQADLHVLGYGIDPDHPQLRDYVARLQQQREERARAMVSRLRALGLPLDFADVKAEAGGSCIGRLHVARALVKRRLAPSVSVAIQQYLTRGAPAFVPKLELGAPAAVRLIHDAGGVAALAHPAMQQVTAERLAELAALGLDGVEVRYSLHSPGDEAYYEALAQDLGLLCTGGSDSHGGGKEGKRHLGLVRVPYAWVEALKQAVARRRALAPQSPSPPSASASRPSHL